MRNKSDIVFACIMGAFFGVAILGMPDKSNTNFQDNLVQNTNSFAANLAAEYNNAVTTGTVTTTNGLADIAPAAGDAAPAAGTPATPAVQVTPQNEAEKDPAETAPAPQTPAAAQ